MFELNDIKKQIDFEYQYGIRDFEITGGEPAEHTKIREICEYIKEKDSNSKIAIITNGLLYRCDVWDIIDELLLSYHIDKNSKNLDKKIFPFGTTYKKASLCVKKANENNILLRTNTVIGSFNIKNLFDIVNDLIQFSPSIINFLPVNLFDESQEMVSYIDYTNLRIKLKECIDILKNKLPDTLIFVRYMPFCDMEGYEQHLVGHIQHIYDWFDWNREIDGVQLLKHIDKDPNKLFGRYGQKSLDICFEQRHTLYEKNNKCMMCKYNIICDGMERANGKLLKHIKPSRGNIIKNPMFFIGNKTKDFYEKRYECSIVGR